MDVEVPAVSESSTSAHCEGFSIISMTRSPGQCIKPATRDGNDQ